MRIEVTTGEVLQYLRAVTGCFLGAVCRVAWQGSWLLNHKCAKLLTFAIYLSVVKSVVLG
jgi:hypothetical protein